jgi:hypothetical protein
MIVRGVEGSHKVAKSRGVAHIKNKRSEIVCRLLLVTRPTMVASSSPTHRQVR